jgi:ABC-type bacteriocin/lantibiotic exporter with double-glycine peptidase domain
MQFRMTFGNQIILAILAVIGITAVTYRADIFGFSNGPKKHYVENFPLVEQPDQITCGPTSALMLLKFYGNDKVTLDQVKSQSKTHWFNYDNTPIGMTAPDVLSNALTKLGLPCKMVKGEISQLKKMISEDRPPIVLVRSGEYTWHYVVAVGYDEKTIVVADPGWGMKRTLQNEHFHGTWSFATDMTGVEAKDKLVAGLLSLAEVHPFTMIIPDEAP